jgi:hypothetical protein
MSNPKRHHLDPFAADLAGNIASGDPDELLDSRTLARLIHVSVQWLEIGRCAGYGPKHVKLNKRVVRYRRADVVAWLRSRSEQPEVR